MSGLQKLRTDLRIVSSDRSFQIVCSAVSGLLRSAVTVSAPGTSPTWLPSTRGSERASGLAVWRPGSLGSACRAVPFVQL